jgi:CHASE2 domain-containing sensor protein
MRIQKHPRLRRLLAVCGLILIIGLLAASLITMVSGKAPGLAMALFGCLVMVSIIMYVFLSYVRRHSEDE